MLAIIGGSGLYRLPGFESTQRQIVRTPFGDPSCPLTFGLIGGPPVVVVARPGGGPSRAPAEINYRANIWALAEQGVSGIVAVGSVGGISSSVPPGTVAVPDQIIDYTWGRAHTYFEGADIPVVHTDLTLPYDARLRARLLQAAKHAGVDAHDGGVYACTQGPRLETAAEIRRLERDGADMVGMTGMPEAALAREKGVPYACLAPVVNWAAGKGDSVASVTFDSQSQGFATALESVGKILIAAVTHGSH